MFTGIIRELGTITKVVRKGNGRTLTIRAPETIHRLNVGSSVSVNGVCLTVVRKRGVSFETNVMPTTLAVTGLNDATIGSKVNIEPSLRMGDELGGHELMGHVDAHARVRNVTKRGMNVLISIDLPRSIRRYVVSKGPIAVDGVSLTVKDIRTGTFDVALIPYTLENTTLGRKRAGDRVNLEADLLAKYVESFRRHKKA